MHMSRQVLDGMIIAAILALGTGHLYTQGFASRKVLHAYAAGGTTASATHGAEGPNGGAVSAEHGVITDGRGNAAGGSTMSARGGAWTHSADGGTQHQSRIAVRAVRWLVQAR